MRRLHSVLIFAASAACLLANGAPDGDWVDYAVEGKIVKMDAELAPRLREGMVFSAVYGLAPKVDAVDLDEAVSRARYFDIVDDVELSIDLNYILVYEASTGMGDRSVELTQAGGDVEAEQDLYSILLPIKGEVFGEEGWTARWLQIWFYGEGGEMLSTVNLQAPPEVYKSGWWRITFWNTEGSRSVIAEGMIEAAGEAGAPLSPSEQIAQLENVVVRLNDELESELSANAGLRSDLEQAQTRINGLQKIVDVIVEERRILQDKYDLLELEKSSVRPELATEVAALEADVALWEEKELAWKDENRALAEALALAEADYSRLAADIEEIEVELTASEPAPGLEPEAMTVTEDTIIVMPEPDFVTEEVSPLVNSPAAEVIVVEEKPRSVFRRPGKFHR